MAKDFLELMEEGDKLESSLGDRTRRIANFDEKLVRFIELIANKPGYSSNKRVYLMKEAETTSDFPLLFGTVLDRQLLAKYQIATPDWRTYIKTGTQKDFRPQDLFGVYGLQGQLKQVKQRGEYPVDASLGEGKVQIKLSKYGRAFPLAWEVLINDDLGAFSDIAERLANGALRTEFYQATSLFVDAAGPHASLFLTAAAHPIDGKVMTNKGALPLTTDNLGKVVTAMRRLVDVDGEPVIFDGFDLVVPPALEYTMLQVLNPANIIMSGGDATAGVKAAIRTSANVTANLNITGHVNPYLPIIDVGGKADTTWYVFAKQSSGGYAARINFLAGHEAPELCMKNANKLSLGGGAMNPLEGDFDTDSIQWRVRHIMGGTQVDPRYAHAETGS